jgi:hypothetical protein
MITIMDCANAVQGFYRNEDIPGFFLKNGLYDPKNTSDFKDFWLIKVNNETVKLQGNSVKYCKSTNNLNCCIIIIRVNIKYFTTKDWLNNNIDISLGMIPDSTNDTLVYIERKLAQT